MRRDLNREEFIWAVLTIHFRDDGETAKQTHWLNKYQFPKQMPLKIRRFIAEFWKIQRQINTLWNIPELTQQSER